MNKIKLHSVQISLQHPDFNSFGYSEVRFSDKIIVLF